MITVQAVISTATTRDIVVAITTADDISTTQTMIHIVAAYAVDNIESVSI
jgi:hypothetical protein